MRKIAVVSLLLLSGCVTTDRHGNPIAEETGRPERPSRLGRAHAQVEARIDKMKYQHGKALLRTMQELIGLKELALEPIAKALPTADSRTRANLVYLLGFMGGNAAHQLIVSRLKDDSEVVRYEAAAALITLGDLSAVPVLITFMDSGNRRLRFKSHQVLRSNTRQDFGYDFNAASEGRSRAIARWRTWWGDQRGELIYGKG
ncbi:MAG: HEAT repeat domain-containing protein [Planctomycetes bacterium]|nr:HEAT repeat domain-containing protein [Planctomycetota bacterium]